MKKLLIQQSGGALLISLLIITALALILTISVNLSSIDGVSRSVDTRESKKSETIAEACIEESLLRLKWDSSYSGGNISFPEGSCSVNISGIGDIKTLSVSGTEGNSVTEISVSIDLSGNSPQVNSWNKGV